MQVIFSINYIIKVGIHNNQNIRKPYHLEIFNFSIKHNLAQGEIPTDIENFKKKNIMKQHQKL